MNADYIGNWLALGACIYGGKTADAALQILGLRKGVKRKITVMILKQVL